MNDTDKPMPSADRDEAIWNYAKGAGKSLLQVAPVNFRLQSEGDVFTLSCTIATRAEMYAVREIIRYLCEAWLPREGENNQATAPTSEESSHE